MSLVKYFFQVGDIEFLYNVRYCSNSINGFHDVNK